MSTSILYHVFGVENYKFLSLILEKNSIGLLVERDASPECPACGSSDVVSKGTRRRWLKALPNGSYRGLYIVVKIRRFLCKTCKSVCQEPVDIISAERLHYTKRFEQIACDLLEFATVKDVARFSGVSWDVIKEIDVKRLTRNKPKWRYKDLLYIAVDEIYLGRVSKYKTIFYNLLSGHIIKVVDGRGGDKVSGFFSKLGLYAKNLKAVAMDMSLNYWLKAHDNIPQAEVVFDRFHVMKLMNDKLDKLRRNYQAECQKAEKQVIKGKRYLLLHNPENLGDDQRRKLDELLELNTPLSKAYILKEELRRLWDEPDFESGKTFLNSWCKKAESSGIALMNEMSKSLKIYRSGILNYFKYGITSGPLEGVNNKIKVMLRKHYGIRDPQYLVLKLLNLKSSKHQLTG